MNRLVLLLASYLFLSCHFYDSANAVFCFTCVGRIEDCERKDERDAANCGAEPYCFIQQDGSSGNVVQRCTGDITDCSEMVNVNPRRRVQQICCATDRCNCVGGQCGLVYAGAPRLPSNIQLVPNPLPPYARAQQQQLESRMAIVPPARPQPAHQQLVETRTASVQLPQQRVDVSAIPQRQQQIPVQPQQLDRSASVQQPQQRVDVIAIPQPQQQILVQPAEQQLVETRMGSVQQPQQQIFFQPAPPQQPIVGEPQQPLVETRMASVQQPQIAQPPQQQIFFQPAPKQQVESRMGLVQQPQQMIQQQPCYQIAPPQQQPVSVVTQEQAGIQQQQQQPVVDFEQPIGATQL